MRGYLLSLTKWFTVHVLPTGDVWWFHCYLVGCNDIYTYDMLLKPPVLVPGDDKTTGVFHRDIKRAGTLTTKAGIRAYGRHTSDTASCANRNHNGNKLCPPRRKRWIIMVKKTWTLLEKLIHNARPSHQLHTENVGTPKSCRVQNPSPSTTQNRFIAYTNYKWRRKFQTNSYKLTFSDVKYTNYKWRGKFQTKSYKLTFSDVRKRSKSTKATRTQTSVCFTDSAAGTNWKQHQLQHKTL